MSKRNYDPTFIKYGFTSIEHNAEILPQCVVCLKTLCNAAMKPSLLKRHLERNHPNKMNADKSYFQRLADNVKRQRMDKTGQMQQKSKDIVAASYEIALLVAKQKQSHTIAESLILPGVKILVKRVFGEQAIAKLNAVSLSDNTIKRRIEEMSDDIANQILLIAEIKESKFGFAIQLDQSTDITNYCQLLVYVRYAQTNIEKTELLLNHEVSTTTKGKDIFDILDSFFKKNGLDLEKSCLVYHRWSSLNAWL